MTYRQLEQYLRTEKWRAGAEYGTDMCGRYARCAYCDRSSAYPCAYAFDAFVRAGGLESEIPEWVMEEPPVGERFGTVYAEPDIAVSAEQYGNEAFDLPQSEEVRISAQEYAQNAAPQEEENEQTKARENKQISAPAQWRKSPPPRGVIKIDKFAGDACVLKIKKKSK